MNVCFLTLVNIKRLGASDLYTDLLREFAKDGDNVYVVSPAEKRSHEETRLIHDSFGTVLRVQTGNIQKTGIIEKGISTVMLEGQFKRAIKKYFADVHFDLVLYSTPPITLAGAVEYLKKRDNARTYLLLKDIFPQNAVDIGMMSKRGLKAPLYAFFRAKEKKLYRISDRIGCMSPANVKYVIDNNPQLDPAKVEVCPNSVDEANIRGVMAPDRRVLVRRRYGIPQNKTVFMYGGNLGRPQCVPHIIECLKACADMKDCYFVVCGSGTDYGLLDSYVKETAQQNLMLIPGLQRAEYEELTAACDIGLIFLDNRFTIPNFPSRLLSYMQCGLPVLCCTDPNTDVGQVVRDGGFGWACGAADAAEFQKAAAAAAAEDRTPYAARALAYLREHYLAADGCKIIKKQQ